VAQITLYCNLQQQEKIHIIEVLSCQSGMTATWRIFHPERWCMATNPPAGDGHRNGAVRDRSQVFNPVTQRWTKRDTETGRFMDQKADGKPFKGVRKEK
jgi:hypothetical protein